MILRRLVLSAALLSLLARCAELPDDAAAQSASAVTSKAATVTVNVASTSGVLPTPYRQNNWSGTNFEAELRPTDVAFLNSQGLHAAIERAWASENAIYSPSTKTYDYTSIDPYLTDLSALSDALLINITGGGFVLSWHDTPAQAKPILKTMLKRLKQTFPKITSVEALNEPNLSPYPSSFTAADDYAYFKVFYQAVNEINAELELHDGAALKVGGPVLANFDTQWLGDFLSAYAADTCSSTR